LLPCHAGGRGFESGRSRQLFEGGPYLASKRHRPDISRVFVIHPKSQQSSVNPRLSILLDIDEEGELDVDEEGVSTIHRLGHALADKSRDPSNQRS
jgi:hypothetical protein